MNWRTNLIKYVNIDSRTDRRTRMEVELKRVGVSAERQAGMSVNDFKGDRKDIQVQLNRAPNSVGCWLAQVAVMEQALKEGRGCVVLEDDLTFCDDIIERLDYIEKYINEKQPFFDIIFLGGTVHKEPTWHKIVNGVHINSEITGKCDCKLNSDWERTSDERIIKTYGAFSTHAYIVNVHSIQKILDLLKSVMYKSIGIDHALIMLQPQLNCFMHIPGCVKQIDNQSNIGKGTTYFSHFAQLGGHWYASKLSDYDNSLMK